MQTAGIVRDLFELRLAPDRTIVSPASRYDSFALYSQFFALDS